MENNYNQEKKDLCSFLQFLINAGNKITNEQLKSSEYPEAEEYFLRLKNAYIEMKTDNSTIKSPILGHCLIENDGYEFEIKDTVLKILKISDKWEIWDIENHADSDDMLYSLRRIGSGKKSKAAKPVLDPNSPEGRKKRKFIIGGSALSVVLLIGLFIVASFNKRPNNEAYKAFLTNYLTQLNSLPTHPIHDLKLDDIDEQSKHHYLIKYSYIEGAQSEPGFSDEEQTTIERELKRISIALMPVLNDLVNDKNKEPLYIYQVMKYEKLSLVDKEDEEQD